MSVIEAVLEKRTVTAAPSDHPRTAEILTPAALGLLGAIHRQYDSRRRALLAARRDVQARYDAGALPDFRADTAAIRAADWQVASAEIVMARGGGEEEPLSDGEIFVAEGKAEVDAFAPGGLVRFVEDGEVEGLAQLHPRRDNVGRLQGFWF